MPSLRLRVLSSVAELRSAAAAWDDLWRRSAVASPTLRAEFTADFIEHFFAGSRVHALVVEDEHRRMLAALPLVERRAHGVVRCGLLPNNHWSSCGDLLLDETTADAAVASEGLVPERACQLLAAGLAELPLDLLWFDYIAYQSDRWRRLLTIMNGAGARYEIKPQFDVGWLPTQGDWAEYTASWSKHHRRNMKRYPRRLEEHGPLRYDVERAITQDDLEPILQDVFAVEDRNWKGDQNSSVLKTPGMRDFYLGQGRRLAEAGELRLNILRLNDEPIASQYGYTSKGVFHPCKIGYDEAYSRESPGNLLMAKVIEACFTHDAVQGVDFSGPLTRSTAAWHPQSYAVGRLMAAPRTWFGKAMLGAYRQIWPHVERWRNRKPALETSDTLALSQ